MAHNTQVLYEYHFKNIYYDFTASELLSLSTGDTFLAFMELKS